MVQLETLGAFVAHTLIVGGAGTVLWRAFFPTEQDKKEFKEQVRELNEKTRIREEAAAAFKEFMEQRQDAVEIATYITNGTIPERFYDRARL